MFIDDLTHVKSIFKRLFKEIGAFAVSYSGFDDNLVESFGDNFEFQCRSDKFFDYCSKHDITPTLKYELQNSIAYEIKINDNSYFTLVDDENVCEGVADGN